MNRPLAPLHDIVENVSDAFSPKPEVTKQFSLFSFEAHDQGKRPVVVEEHEMKSGKKCCRAGDVLFAKLNPRIPRIWLIEEEDDKLLKLCSTEFVVLRAKKGADLDPEYLALTLQAPQFLEAIQSQVSSTTKSHQRVRPALIFDQCIPQPPRVEQQRIAAIIQASLARVDEMEHERSVADDETDSLLPSGLRHLFERAIAEHETVELGELTVRSQYGTNAKCSETAEGLPILRIPNVAGGRVNFDKLKYAHLPERERQKVVCAPGDLLIVRTNGSPKLVGRCAVFDAEVDFGYASYIIRFRLHRERVLPEYVSYFLRSPQGREHIARIRQTSAGQFNVNSENLRGIPIPLPKLTEQTTLVEMAREVERAANLTHVELTALESECAALRQSILREAFAGNL